MNTDSSPCVQKMSSLEERAKKEIEKSGMPTEIKVARILRKYGWIVQSQYVYFDTSKNKLRPVDIKAILPYTEFTADRKLETKKDITLYVECKKSIKQSWVFYTEEAISWLEVLIRAMKFDQTSVFRLVPTEHKFLKSKIAYLCQTIFGGKDDFYKAQMQVLKSLKYCEKEVQKHPRAVYPVILFDGHIFECDLVDEDIKIAEIQFVRYLSGGLPEDYYPVLIDVMTLTYLPKYLEALKIEFDKFEGKSPPSWAVGVIE